MIASVEASGKWTFTTVAPEYSRKAFVQDYGFKPGNFFGYNPDVLPAKLGSLSMNTVGLASYATTRSTGATASASTFVPQGVKIDLTVNNNTDKDKTSA